MKSSADFDNGPGGFPGMRTGLSRRIGTLLSGIGAGTLLMYFFDPRTGKRRRARLRDQIVHAERVLTEAQRIVVQDLANRAAGAWAETTRWLRDDGTGDEALTARIRARLGRVVSHPHALSVNVAAHEGLVILGGPILRREVEPLLACVRKVPGVHTVENRLDAHDKPDRISALQGGRPRRGERFELLQDRWSPSARVVAGALGTGLIAHGARAGGPLGFAVSLLGGALFVRAAANLETRSLLGIGEDTRGIDVQKTVHVAAPPERVFEFWTDYRNFPRFMARVRKVLVLDEKRSRWTVSGPAGVPIEWTAEITNLVPNELLEWASVPGSRVRHHGIVRFDREAGGGTRVHVRLRYLPQGGAIGHAVASFFAADPRSGMDEDLARMKFMLDTGRAPRDAAQPPAARTAPIEGGPIVAEEIACDVRKLSR